MPNIESIRLDDKRGVGEIDRTDYTKPERVRSEGRVDASPDTEPEKPGR